LHLLPNGRVLSWGRNGDPQVWDPLTGGFTAVPAPSWLFCAGHDFLPDGRLFVAGGHITDDHGLPNANVFDAATGSWQQAPAMAHGRWYPTTTTLAAVPNLRSRDDRASLISAAHHEHLAVGERRRGRQRSGWRGRHDSGGLERRRLAPADDSEPGDGIL